MKDTTAKQRINKAVREACKGQSEAIINYFKELIFRDYQSFKYSDYTEESDTNNLNFAIEIHLQEDFKESLAELIEEEKQGKKIKLL